jgi:hypothetical protein
MKLITNDSLQSFEVFLRTPSGAKSVWLAPKKSIVVPGGYISEQIMTMINRRLLSLRNA